MTVMKNLTALTLTAALVPALAFSTAAFAESSDDMQAGSEQAAGTEQHSGEKYMSSKPAGAMYGNEIIGTSVKNRGSEESIGSIQDLVIDEDGQIVGVVLTTSSFLGLGGQEVGLNWDQLEHGTEGEESMFFVDIDEETLRNAPPLERE